MKDEKHTKVGFELFDHTADIGVIAHGSEVTAVFEQAALGMFTIIFHGTPPEVKSKGEYEIKLNAKDLEQLMVDWLDELLYIYSTEHIVFSKFKIDIDVKNFILDANVYGEIVSDDLLLGTCEIKAVTYHMLEVKNINDHWEAKILFDI
jgi:SHS2 domain-containing protein